MKAALVVFALCLSGCSLIPSKWDLNQARVITNIRQEAGAFDCKKDIPTQLAGIEKQIEWFRLYSEFRGTKDIEALIAHLDTNVTEFQARVAQGPVSQTYCQIKKIAIVQESEIIGHTIEGSL